MADLYPDYDGVGYKYATAAVDDAVFFGANF